MGAKSNYISTAFNALLAIDRYHPRDQMTAILPHSNGEATMFQTPEQLLASRRSLWQAVGERYAHRAVTLRLGDPAWAPINAALALCNDAVRLAFKAKFFELRG